MKNLTFLFILFSTFSFSQTHRFIYEFKHKTDSTAQDFKKDNMVLDIDQNFTQFYEFRAIRMDSINRNSRGLSTYSYPFVKLKRKVASEKNTNFFLLGENYFAFESIDKMQWKIQPETKSKGDWKLQKATTNFGGRNWEAWFTPDIPFSEGPYKFNGLPGLIVELRDMKNNFSYEMTKIEKPKNANPNIVETLFKKKPIAISFKKYQELQIANYNDPYARFRSMKPGSWAIGRADETFVETIEGLTKITKEEQAFIRKNNNPIEIDKVIKYSEL